MKLELKHLAPYVCHKLIIADSLDLRYELSYYLNGDKYCKIYEVIEADGLKPLLRPLSDINKEIEHDGEKFVPYDRLQQDGFPIECIGNDELAMHIGTDVRINLSVARKLNEHLFEWHFDVFKLIPEGLAIKKD